MYFLPRITCRSFTVPVADVILPWLFSPYIVDEGNGPDRMCSVTGTTEKMHMATNMIQELVQNALVRSLACFLKYVLVSKICTSHGL